jgi:hypothetical protein
MSTPTPDPILVDLLAAAGYDLAPHRDGASWVATHFDTGQQVEADAPGPAAREALRLLRQQLADARAIAGEVGATLLQLADSCQECAQTPYLGYQLSVGELQRVTHTATSLLTARGGSPGLGFDYTGCQHLGAFRCLRFASSASNVTLCRYASPIIQDTAGCGHYDHTQNGQAETE